MRPGVLVVVLTLLSCSAGAPPSGPRPPERKLRVVFFTAHPDDPMWGAAGLMALLSRDGHEVISAYGTCFRRGRRVGEEPEADVRRREAAASCKVVGATPKFFDYSHEEFVAAGDVLKKVSAWLDEIRPDIVVTHWPTDTHPNHHAAASLVWQCYRPRGGWTLYWFELLGSRQTVGFRPQLYLDLDPVRSLKKDALDCHEGSLRAISSPAPGEPWRKSEGAHRIRGEECGVARAEAFALLEAKEGCPLLPVPFLRRKNAERPAETYR
jgi:N-acetylglucosamine malate deacetylase 1